jgi:hypothetical protein
MVKQVGFLEYASSIFFEKDQMKVKLLVSSKNVFPQLIRDKAGFVCIFPEPVVNETKEEKTLSYVGYRFPSNALGERQLVNLFRSSVYHLGAHALSSSFEDYEGWKKRKDARLTKFTISLLEDVKANLYISTRYPEKLPDLAFANVLAFKRLRQMSKILNPATRAMTSLLVGANIGSVLDGLKKEQNIVTRLAELLTGYERESLESMKDTRPDLRDERLKLADAIYNGISDVGTIIETPFLPHTDELGTCSLFPSPFFVDSDVTQDPAFGKCLQFLSGSSVAPKDMHQANDKVAEAEAIQVFDSWQHQKEKEKRIISRYNSLLSLTSFKSVVIPEQDYTEFLRINARCKSETHRLIESLLVARDALDEDPRKNYGVLDLQEIIQVIASKSPRMDVFMLDENLSKSYSWIILLDVSKSMKCIMDFALEILLAMAEVSNQILLDPTSWAVYAFSDRFYVIKDPKERYNARVKSRIGGLKFEGFTYLPDALKLAGQIIKARSENMRLITVISDGWPYGYSDMDATLAETLDNLAKRSVSVIGIGTKSRKMEAVFKPYVTVYDLRDLTKKFSNLYFEASRIAAET